MKNINLILMLMMLLSGAMLSAQTPWQTTSAAGVTFQYRVTQDSQNIEGKLSAQTTGWVAVGFNPTSVMRNANIIIGYVSGANTMIRDDWGTSNTSHASDLSLGGADNVSLVSGTESAGSTQIHFTIPLATTDQYDRNLQIGQTYTVILAKGSNSADNYTGQHNDAGYGSITLQAPVANSDEIQNPVLSLSSYPNPFNPQSTIRYSLERSGELELSFFNSRGMMVHRVRKTDAAGLGSYLWNADNLPSGTYIVKLKSGEMTGSLRVNLIK